MGAAAANACRVGYIGNVMYVRAYSPQLNVHLTSDMEGVPSKLSRSLARTAQEIAFAFVIRSELEGRHKNYASPPSLNFLFLSVLVKWRRRTNVVEREVRCGHGRKQTMMASLHQRQLPRCVAVIAAFPLRPPSRRDILHLQSNDLLRAHPRPPAAWRPTPVPQNLFHSRRMSICPYSFIPPFRRPPQASLLPSNFFLLLGIAKRRVPGLLKCTRAHGKVWSLMLARLYYLSR